MTHQTSATPRTIAFIGAGNMASAIFGGMIEAGYPADRIIATARSRDTLEALEQRYGVTTTQDNADAVARADVIVLGVKPQMMHDVCQALAPAVQERKPLVISVAAGITCDSLERWLGGELAIIRCMPNTPSLVGVGASGLYATSRVTDEQRALMDEMLTAVGIVEWVEEEGLLEAVTGISGSGPAYFFLFIEALEAAGIELGLDAETARRLAIQTGRGAAQMAFTSEHEPAELRRRVCSPNGTTERAINSFEGDGLREIVSRAAKASSARAAELARELDQ
ncbi:pyrroline-5-carboxylate reductase [Cobetia marina]|jgi:pyrroline-5-carboxylate reductase|uniref:pyrroline-5-carboxylate reductase n=1 Tax=Cobetia TaxID=204286 RepID=UPI000864EB6A|nr:MULTISPECIES: pyrroline-5-carboxylate reductase [Cobetia]AOM02532.1 pyrroline-5-carboxylate reductase [Cobetia marina]AZV32332.1 pyrroline-5-carboxylate reductase [Cobetia sp. ICG0124]MDH2291888.1 pyrroline-5-carboxylate reductase [Cobetia sp. 10Alg 146]MDH2374423.1 pyrroline-5-carboxylate reductase [Cobetia sp. 3AK]MDI6004388.1 pyrroline-5-carboxylate reductase [Cobetia pacifica]